MCKQLITLADIETADILTLRKYINFIVFMCFIVLANAFKSILFLFSEKALAVVQHHDGIT